VLSLILNAFTSFSLGVANSEDDGADPPADLAGVGVEAPLGTTSKATGVSVAGLPCGCGVAGGGVSGMTAGVAVCVCVAPGDVAPKSGAGFLAAAFFTASLALVVICSTGLVC
jgi:hypothetical protein